MQGYLPSTWRRVPPLTRTTPPSLPLSLILSLLSDYLFDAIANERFYIICPDNDVSTEVDRKRIQWAAGDITERDVPLSRWDPDWKDAFAEYMARP